MSTITKTDIVNTPVSINFKTIDMNTNDKNIIKDEIIKASETGLVNSLIHSNLALTPALYVFAIDSSCSIANTVSKLAIVKPKESPPTPANKSTTLIL